MHIMTEGDVLPYIVLYKGIGSTNQTEEDQITGSYTIQGQTIPLVDELGNSPVIVTDGACKTFHGTGSQTGPTVTPRPRIIVCNNLFGLPTNQGDPLVMEGTAAQGANFPFTQFTLVHELGHVFDNRTTSSSCVPDCRLLLRVFQSLTGAVCPQWLTDSLRGNASTPAPMPMAFSSSCQEIVDSNTRRVMGLINSTTYGRRDRGWGSGPDTGLTSFQQHPAGVYASDPPTVVVEEEIADMFLNWVYRKISDPQPNYRFGLPGTWDGFRNQSWGTYGEYNYSGDDELYPGGARFEWMDIVMSNIFVEKGWQ